jgi:hypothetical protein
MQERDIISSFEREVQNLSPVLMLLEKYKRNSAQFFMGFYQICP